MFQFRIDTALIQILIHIHQNILLCSTWLPCLACFLEAKHTSMGMTTKHILIGNLKDFWDLKLTLLWLSSNTQLNWEEERNHLGSAFPFISCSSGEKNDVQGKSMITCSDNKILIWNELNRRSLIKRKLVKIHLRVGPVGLLVGLPC